MTNLVLSNTTSHRPFHTRLEADTLQTEVQRVTYLHIYSVVYRRLHINPIWRTSSGRCVTVPDWTHPAGTTLQSSLQHRWSSLLTLQKATADHKTRSLFAWISDSIVFQESCLHVLTLRRQASLEESSLQCVHKTSCSTLAVKYTL